MLIEYIGGPWDGETNEVRDESVQSCVIRVYGKTDGKTQAPYIGCYVLPDNEIQRVFARTSHSMFNPPRTKWYWRQA